MILTIDIGNSNIVIGGVEGEKILFEARLRTEATKTSDQYCVDLKILLDVYGIDRSTGTDRRASGQFHGGRADAGLKGGKSL